jgi:beta-xylosidase
VPVVFSPDLETFTLLGDALPVLPAWARPGRTWAPEVIAGEHGYLLYFVARERRTQLQVIGVACAEQPGGPFVAASAPLIRMAALGGAIDPAALSVAGSGSHSGERYLYWKNDGNAAKQATSLWGARLSPDGLSLAGEPTRLLGASERWECQLVEAPQVIQADDGYHLLYSAADYGSARYAIGHAYGPSPLGPFEKTRRGPLLASHRGVAGPGHSHAFRDAQGHWRLAYHAWHPGRVGYPRGWRRLLVSPFSLDGRHARVG